MVSAKLQNITLTLETAMMFLEARNNSIQKNLFVERKNKEKTIVLIYKISTST